MTLRSKIILNAVIVVGMAAGLAILTLWALSRTNQAALVISNEVAPQMVASSELMTLVFETRLSSRSFSHSGDSAHLQRARIGLERIQAAISEARRFASAIPDQEFARELADCQDFYYHYRQLVDDTEQTYLRARSRVDLQNTASEAFHEAVTSLRENPISRISLYAARAGARGEEADLYGEIGRAADKVLAGVHRSHGSLDPQKIRPLIGDLASFERRLQEGMTKHHGNELEPVITRLRDAAAALRNSLVGSLIEARRLETLQVSRPVVGKAFITRLGEISDRCRTDFFQHMKQTTGQLLGVSSIIVIGCVLMLATASVLVTMHARSLISAITGVATISEEMARGNLNLSLSVRSTDEIGRMAVSLNTTIGVLRTLFADLSLARDQAVSAERTKSQFLANMSHEIRTPLNVILGLTGVALQSRLTPDQREDLTMVHQSAEHLLDLLNDILDVSKLEAGQFRLTEAPMSVRETINEIVDIYINLASSKSVKVVCTVDGAVPDLIISDRVRVRQILANLLSNALKFTDRGTVELSVERLEATREGKLRLGFRITDTGIGIDPEVIGRLFKPFVQADGSMSRKYGGTGLGLTISKQLCEMMGGSITVTSQQGHGSVFAFSICVEVAPSGVPASRDHDVSTFTREHI